MDFLFRLIVTVAPIADEVFSVIVAEVNTSLSTLWDHVDDCSQSSRSKTILGLRQFNRIVFGAFFFWRMFHFSSKRLSNWKSPVEFSQAKNAVGVPQGSGSITLSCSFKLSSFISVSFFNNTILSFSSSVQPHLCAPSPFFFLWGHCLSLRTKRFVRQIRVDYNHPSGRRFINQEVSIVQGHRAAPVGGARLLTVSDQCLEAIVWLVIYLSIALREILHSSTGNKSKHHHTWLVFTSFLRCSSCSPVEPCCCKACLLPPDGLLPPGGAAQAQGQALPEDLWPLSPDRKCLVSRVGGQ